MRRNKRKRLYFICISFLISLICLFFVIYKFRDNMIFYYSPSELNHETLLKNQIIRIGGLVKEGSVKYSESNLEIDFYLTDLKEEIKVKYKGILPNLFREKQGIIARGIFDKNKSIFIADELLAKHDENYIPLEVKKSLKKNSEIQ